MSVKILTIDDSDVIRLMVTRAFKAFDCTVIEADNGGTGLALAMREKPDIILLDYSMPVLDGLGVLAKLRSNPDLKATPVIMLTAEAAREIVIKIAQLGVRDYLVKPFKAEVLAARVARVVDLKLKHVAAKKKKRLDDPLGILVVDDKPAIATQVAALLADTPWKVAGVESPSQAVDHCMKNEIDVVLVSLLLPHDGAFMLFQNLRSYAQTSSVAVLGLCVRTATVEQTRAQQSGFAGVVTKPIDPLELKEKICRSLGLETSYRYFQQKEGALTLSLPKEFDPAVAQEVTASLEGQLISVVDAGGNKLIIDLNSLEAAALPVIELVLAAIQSASKLSLRCAVVASATIKSQCARVEESKTWAFADSFENALALLK
jgi:two-component system cell cycle response regulator